jgi:hypothetical protein
MRSLLGLALGVCVLLASFTVLAFASGGADADEVLLKESRIATDGPGLLAFFRERAHTAPTDDALKALVDQLGDDSFQRRESASRQLVAIGGRAKSFLQKAVSSEDYEIAYRAKVCLA